MALDWLTDAETSGVTVTAAESKANLWLMLGEVGFVL
jgi:hypothetical protein